MRMNQCTIFFGYIKRFDQLTKKENALERYGKAHRIKHPDIEKVAAAGTVNLQLNLDPLSAAREREAAGRTGGYVLCGSFTSGVWSLSLDLLAHQYCPQWERSGSSEENGVQVGEKK